MTSAANGRAMMWSDMSESEGEDDFADDSSSVSSFVPATPVAYQLVPVGVVVPHQGHLGPVGGQWVAAPQSFVQQQGNPAQPMHPGGMPAHVIYGRVEMCASSNSSTTSAENRFGGGSGAGLESKPSRRRLQNKLMYENKDVHYARGDSSSECSFQSQSSTHDSPQAGPHQPPAARQRLQLTSRNNAPQPRGERRKPKLAAELAPEAQAEACGVSPEILAQIPYDEEGNITTVGSIKHATGNCRPCAFLYTNVGCNKGIACAGCHIPHRRKDRPRLGRRERMKDSDFGKAASVAQSDAGAGRVQV